MLGGWEQPGNRASLHVALSFPHFRGNLGSLHLQVRLQDETVLPSSYYQPLVQLLCQEAKAGMQVRAELSVPFT